MTIRCNNWDSEKPEKLFDSDGRTLGVLMPRIDLATLQASPGIQSHSTPGGSPDVKLFAPTSVADFAAHWEKTYQRTYPLATENSDA